MVIFLSVTINNYPTISSLYTYNKQLDFSHDKMYLKSLVDSNDNTLIINYTSLINKYYDIVLRHCYTITLKDNEYARYKFQPKLFCYETYGTTELWAILLKINNWTSVTQFNAKTFKTFRPSIFEVINDILIRSADDINDNEVLIGR